jgi:hypothetical protein
MSETFAFGLPSVQSVAVMAGAIVATKVLLAVFEFEDDAVPLEYAPAIIAPAVTTTMNPTMNHIVALFAWPVLFFIVHLFYLFSTKMLISSLDKKKPPRMKLRDGR